MKWLMAIALVCAIGCETLQENLDRVEAVARPMIERWIVEHPDETLTEAAEREIWAAAEKIVQAEIDKQNADDQAEAAKKLAETAGHLASGDYVGGGIGLLTLVLWWIGVRKR